MSAFKGLMQSTSTPSREDGFDASADKIGRNAASVFPEAVAAEMMTSWSPSRIGVAA